MSESYFVKSLKLIYFERFDEMALRLGKKRRKEQFLLVLEKNAQVSQDAPEWTYAQNAINSVTCMAACSHLNILNSFCFCLTRQVFQREADDCGRFYHPKCVATLLYPDSKLDASLLGDKIAARQNFTCPIHECIVCKGEGNKNDRNMQLAVCRRCPTTYHRGYLPRFSSVPLSLSCNVLLVKT